MTCLEKKKQAAQTIENPYANAEQIAKAREVLKEESCAHCRNPLTRILWIDDLVCERKD